MGRAQLVVVDMGVAGDLDDLKAAGQVVDRRVRPGTDNMANGPAMSRAEALRCVESGVKLAVELAATTDVFGTGDMGIGNTTSSAAIAAARRRHKTEVVRRTLQINQPDATDGLDVLTKVGGFEIGGADAGRGPFAPAGGGGRVYLHGRSTDRPMSLSGGGGLYDFGPQKR